MRALVAKQPCEIVAEKTDCVVSNSSILVFNRVLPAFAICGLFARISRVIVLIAFGNVKSVDQLYAGRTSTLLKSVYVFSGHAARLL